MSRSKRWPGCRWRSCPGGSGTTTNGSSRSGRRGCWRRPRENPARSRRPAGRGGRGGRCRRAGAGPASRRRAAAELRHPVRPARRRSADRTAAGAAHHPAGRHGAGAGPAAELRHGAADRDPGPAAHRRGAVHPHPARAGRRPAADRARGRRLARPVGAAAQVRYETTVAALRLTAIGVYPAEFVVKIGDGRQVGAVRTYLPFFPDGVARPTEVSWLLPYADPDLIALTGNGLTELAQTRRETLQTLGQQLHAVVSTQVAWPAGGLLTDRALDAVVTQGAQVVVLDAAALPNTGGEPSGRTGSAASPLPSASGNAVALVTDTGLQRVVTAAVRVAGGQRLVEQRYLAELAMITAEAPSVQRRILVAPPHDWSPLPDAAAGMLRDTRDVGWLTPGSVAELARSTELVNRGALVYPRGAPELPADQAGRIRKLQELVDQFRSALDNIAENQLLERYTHALQRAASAAWRTTPGAPAGSIAAPPDLTGAMFLAPIASRITTVVTKQVYIVRPQDGKYSLASQNSLLPLTVVNNLDVRVHVRVRISAQGMVGFQAQEVDATLEGGKRTLVRIPATVTQSGRFRVTAVLLTPD